MKTWMSMNRLPLLLALLALVSVSAAAQGQQQRVVVGKTFLAASADPADGNAGWALTSHGVGEKLFSVGRDGRLAGALARSAERAADGSWEVALQPGRRFSDGAPVTAAEVAAALARTNERNPAARASVGRMTLQALDELRLRIRTERPTPVMAAVLAEWPFVVYRVAERPVFTGPYAIAALRPGDAVDLVPNAHHPGAEQRPPLTIKRFPDGQSMALALEGREIDMAFNLPVESLPRLRSRDGLGTKSFPVGYQYMMWFNTRRPSLADVRVRQALGLAIDRRELVQAVRAGEVATGAFPLDTPHALREALPTDTAQAARLLDEAGWLRGADGRRARDGQPLRLVLVAYPQRPDLVTLQPVIRARLAALGIEVRTRVAEQPSAVASSGDFDLLLWAQHTLPAGDPGFFLEAFFRSGSSSNFPGLSSPEIDRALDRLAGAESPAERVAAAAAAHRTVIAQAPVSFLMTPVWHVGLGSRLAGYEPWGSDYHVVRADMGLRR